MTTTQPGPQTADLVARDAAVVADAMKIRYAPFVIERGDGALLYDADGREFIDFGAGWAIASLGYSNERICAAAGEQMARSIVGGGISSINRPMVELAERLVKLVPGDFAKSVWFGLSGSDTSEAAQRLILAATGKPRIITFVGGWHGTTDATMALSAHPSLSGVRGGAHVTKVPYPDPYRPPFGDRPGNLTDHCLDFLESYLFATICPPGEVAAVFVEAVQSDGGDIVPPPDFMPKLRALCDRHGILLVLDEIKVGMGRTGRWFSYQHSDVVPDFTLLGKALGGGLPLSAIVGRKEILDVGSGMALFSLVGNATSCAVSLAVIEEIERLDLVARAASSGDLLLDLLSERLSPLPEVGDVRGLGMILGVELVRDRQTKEPDQPLAAKVAYRCWELGLIVYAAGNWGNVLEITPPLVIEEAEMRRGVAILEQAIIDVRQGLVSDGTMNQFAGW